MFDFCAAIITAMINNTSKLARIFNDNLHLEMVDYFCLYALPSLLNKGILRGTEIVIGHFKFVVL
jgi:hypothetical protein